MLILKEEHKNTIIKPMRYALGKMNQHQLQYVKERYGNKYFESPKKPKKDNDNKYFIKK